MLKRDQMIPFFQFSPPTRHQLIKEKSIWVSELTEMTKVSPSFCHQSNRPKKPSLRNPMTTNIYQCKVWTLSSVLPKNWPLENPFTIKSKIECADNRFYPEPEDLESVMTSSIDTDQAPSSTAQTQPGQTTPQWLLLPEFP